MALLTGARGSAGVEATRLERAVDLFHERGYAPRVELLARVLGHDAADVSDAARADPALVLRAGHVARAGEDALLARSAQRATAHEAASTRWLPVAHEYATSIARHLPWVRVVLLSGSLASGGSDDEDDIDVSLVVQDGAKHLAYIACLALALPYAWRYRRRAHGASARLPFLPKLVCINVVWTASEAAPFARTDDRMALEVALSRPLVAGDTWRAILAANPALGAQFCAAEAPGIPPPPPSRAARALARLPRAPLDALCYQLARLAHAVVRWARRRDPATRARVARLEATKAPYAILDRPPRRRA